MEQRKDSSSFTTGNTAQERGLPYVPDCYVTTSSSPPLAADLQETSDSPVIDLGGFRQDAAQRARVIQQIGDACRNMGFFLNIVNHGICQSVLDGAVSAAFDFFNLPTNERMKLVSSDVCKPVRYGTSIKDGTDKYQFWRVFLKHYAYPLSHWIDLWPNNPPDYREKMGKYCTEVRKLALELMAAMTDQLGLGPNYLGNRLDEGVQVMAVNCYPPCPNPDMALGLPPHSDYSCITIVLQSSSGLEIIPRDGKWRSVPHINGGLLVHVGDHFEVLSNGIYNSVVHRAVLNSERTRISIASLHSLGMDDEMETAKELVDDQHPKGYKKSSFRDFLNFLSNNDIAQGKSFMNALKIKS